MSTVLTPRALESYLAGMTADQLDHLSATLRARATERRRTMTEDECRNAVANAPVTLEQEKSQLSRALRVRNACRILIAEHRLHPEQFIESMTSVAEEIIDLGHEAAVEAVGGGIADGMFERETDDE